MWFPDLILLTFGSLVFEVGILFCQMFLFPSHNDVNVARIIYVSFLVQTAI